MHPLLLPFDSSLPLPPLLRRRHDRPLPHLHAQTPIPQMPPLLIIIHIELAARERRIAQPQRHSPEALHNDAPRQEMVVVVLVVHDEAVGVPGSQGAGVVPRPVRQVGGDAVYFLAGVDFLQGFDYAGQGVGLSDLVRGGGGEAGEGDDGVGAGGVDGGQHGGGAEGGCQQGVMTW